MTTVKAYTIPFTRLPAAEWETPLTRYQAVNTGEGLLLGWQSVSGGEWVTTPVTAPERFGEYKTPKQIEKWVENFLSTMADEE
jgi:hypothetical protein